MAILLTLAAACAMQAKTATAPEPRPDAWWRKRHEAMASRVAQGNVGIVFIGDSITHAFGGDPDTSESFSNRGGSDWKKHYASRNAVNLGISGDRTQHVLWRLQRYDLGRAAPKAAIVMIGTNNMTLNTEAEIAAGVEAICGLVVKESPKTKVLLLGIFPRAEPSSKMRRKVEATNRLLRSWAKGGPVMFLDIGGIFLDAKGNIPASIMPDGLHPSDIGYGLWARAMEPTLARILKG